MPKILAFNWKMNPDSPQKAEDLFNFYLKTLHAQHSALNADIIICPPFVYLEKFSASLRGSASWRRRSNLIRLPRSLRSLAMTTELGAQNCFWENQNAFTGEISPMMLKKLGVEYVIIGHSERRQILGETDVMINKKIGIALKAGLKVILCVGEPKRATSDKRQETRKAKNYVKNQLKRDLKNISLSHAALNKSLIIAYEPIWAIGTGNYCEPKDAAEMIKFIKNYLKVKVLYGGSVSSQNIKSFLQYKEIDGCLVGGASIKLQEIKNIIKSL